MISRKSHIKKVAAQVLKRSGCSAPPVSLDEVAKAVELEIIPFAFAEKISGLLKKEQGVIAVNNTHSPARQRFTAAHELGHYLLGHDMGHVTENTIVDDSFDKPIDAEREANLFASFILMPGDWVKKAVGNEQPNLDHLAKQFQVSKQAITIRLMELKVI